MHRRLHEGMRLALFLVASLALSAACGDDDGVGSDGGGTTGDSGRPPTDSGRPGTDSGPTDRDSGPPRDGGPTGGLPTGDMGIAARHPGDVGICDDPDAIFCDDFESYADADDLWDNWFNRFGDLAITRDTENVYAGSQALQMTQPRQTDEHSNGLMGEVSPELDVMFLRWYAKLDTTFDIVGSSHNGGGISAHYFEGFMATPGIRADGMNKFLIEYECWRGESADANPGSLNVYIYHPAQRDNYGDHFFPNGDVMPNTSIPGDFGSEFIPRENITPELGRWYAFEVMLQANTPGERDGRVAMWLDGRLVADFPNLRLRDVPELTIDHFGISLHAGSNPVAETYKWVDNVVAARSYIGPLVR